MIMIKLHIQGNHYNIILGHGLLLTCKHDNIQLYASKVSNVSFQYPWCFGRCKTSQTLNSNTLDLLPCSACFRAIQEVKVILSSRFPQGLTWKQHWSWFQGTRIHKFHSLGFPQAKGDHIHVFCFSSVAWNGWSIGSLANWGLWLVQWVIGHWGG